MPRDMKRAISEAARMLLVDKRVKKLTVKDIVEECHITRQTFYYHFEDIPSLLKWMLEQGTSHIIRTAQGEKKEEEALRYFFIMAIHAAPYVKRTMETNYREEIERLLKDHIYQTFEQAIEEKHLYQNCSQFELKLILRYHSRAVLGLLQEWTEEDTKNLDSIVHEVYLLMQGSLSSFSDQV